MEGVYSTADGNGYSQGEETRHSVRSFLKRLVFKCKNNYRPNDGFMEQLKLWDQMNCRIDDQCKTYKAYRLKRAAHEVKGAYIKKEC